MGTAKWFLIPLRLQLLSVCSETGGDGKFLPPDLHQAQPVGLSLLHELPSDLAKRCSQCRVDKVN